MAHRPHAPSPGEKMEVFSLSLQLRDPNMIGLRRAPQIERSNEQIPVFVDE